MNFNIFAIDEFDLEYDADKLFLGYKISNLCSINIHYCDYKFRYYCHANIV